MLLLLYMTQYLCMLKWPPPPPSQVPGAGPTESGGPTAEQYCNAQLISQEKHILILRTYSVCIPLQTILFPEKARESFLHPCWWF